MRTLNTTSEVLLRHVAVPAKHLQMVRESHLANCSPPVPGVVFSSVLLTVCYVVNGEERRARFTATDTLTAIMDKHFQPDSGISGIGFTLPSFSVLRSTLPSLSTFLTLGTCSLALWTRITATAQTSTIAGSLALAAFLRACLTLTFTWARRTTGATTAETGRFSLSSPLSGVFTINHNGHYTACDNVR